MFDTMTNDELQIELEIMLSLQGEIDEEYCNLIVDEMEKRAEPVVTVAQNV